MQEKLEELLRNILNLKKERSLEDLWLQVLDTPLVNIDGGGMVIRENELEANSIVQIDNITQMWEGTVPRKPLKVINILIVVLIGYLFASGTLYPKLIGYIIFISLGYYFYNRYTKARERAVNIEISSGRIFSLVSKDREFISKVFKYLSKIIIEKNVNINQVINFETGTFINSIDSVNKMNQTINIIECKKFINKIEKIYGTEEFDMLFKDNVDKAINLLQDIKELLENNTNNEKIKTKLEILKDIAVGVGTSFIGDGIILGLKHLLNS